MSSTDTILMIRPVHFKFNEQTASNNYYQHVDKHLSEEQGQAKAQKEFDDFVQKLREKDIRVIVIEDTPETDTPDSIFPNNWVSFHSEGTVIFYPMFAENRRLERRDDILEILKQSGNFRITRKVDLSGYENEGRFLEGTGSMVLDRTSRVAYAALSERTDHGLFRDFCDTYGYRPVAFTAYQSVGNQRLPIYHTNVMMAVGEDFAVICAECIDDETERMEVISALEDTGKEVILISEEQVRKFAGNMLEVRSSKSPGKRYLIMSQSAYDCLTEIQRAALSSHCEIIYSPLDTIEELGGGSARCMMAEVFLPPRQTL
jgi:hypothetical protein